MQNINRLLHSKNRYTAVEFHSELNNKLHANLYNNKLAWDSFEYLQKFIPSIHVKINTLHGS